jgi:hypothetical protein
MLRALGIVLLVASERAAGSLSEDLGFTPVRYQ